MASELESKEPECTLTKREKKRKQKKDLKEGYKKLKEHFALRFRGAIEKLYAGNFSLKEIDLFCEYEPTINNTIENLKTKQIEKQKAEVYNAVINRKEHLIEIYLKQTQDEYKWILEEEQRLSQTRAYIPKEIDFKISKLAQIQKRKQDTEHILADLFEIKEALIPKKKLGRPKKNKEATGNVIIGD